MLRPTADAVNTVQALPKNQRTAKVNAFMAGPAKDKLTLQWRSMFISELREREVWPQGCK